MKLDNKRFLYLHNNYLAKNLTAGELKEYSEMVLDVSSHAQFTELLDKHWYELQSEGLAAVPEAIDQRVYDFVVQHKTRSIYRRLWFFSAVAAALALIISGVYLFKSADVGGRNSSLETAVNIAPGRNGATLTLANGKKISLTEAGTGQIAKEAGITITKSGNGELVYHVSNVVSETNKINILSTGKGETYSIKLPDGSMVWLNAASRLTYTAGLYVRGIRKLKLEGEGYFEIARDKDHPFVVESKGQEVAVLGTHFNINSYDDEPLVRTTLLEGSIQLNHNFVLRPGQQSILRNGIVKIKEVSVQKVIAWKNGVFIFDNEPLESIMRKLSRWYDVDVVYEDIDKSQLFAGGISRYDNIAKVLTMMERTGDIHFKIEGRRVIVTK